MLVTSQKPVSVEQEQPTDKYEALRAIVMRQENREVNSDEAREIGEALIDFYQILAEEVADDATN